MLQDSNTSTTQTAVDSLHKGRRIELSANATERRRMILKSLGKGASIASVVSIPMQSLAAIGTLSVTVDGGKRCTISGTMSAVHSQETTVATCEGWSPGYYKMLSHWPNYSALGNPTAQNNITGGTGHLGQTTFNKNTFFDDLFGAGHHVTLINCMLDNNNNQVEFHWIAALLNGTSGSPAINFPYPNGQVIALYKAGDGTKNDPAYKFFADYMETHIS